MGSGDQFAFEGMRERTMTNVMQQDGDTGTLFFRRADRYPFSLQFVQRFRHQVVGP